jgi:carboxymethylenebutenolidase
MALRDYILREVTSDYAESVISRREALRRLGLLGLSATAAGALLAACGESGSSDETRTARTTGPTRVDRGAIEVEDIIFDGPRGDLFATVANAAQPKGAVLVIHEIFGLTDHIRSLPPRFASDGYTALAIDLVSEEGGTGAVGGDTIGVLGAASEDRLVADLRAGLTELGRREPDVALAAVGFCFGGGMTWQLLAAGEPRLSAAVPFYGPVPTDADFSGSRAAVLAIYGELDTRVNATRDTAVAALEAAGLIHEVRTFAGASHGFFNDTGARYHEAAATEAYALVLDWFAEHLR